MNTAERIKELVQILSDYPDYFNIDDMLDLIDNKDEVTRLNTHWSTTGKNDNPITQRELNAVLVHFLREDIEDHIYDALMGR